MSQETFEWLNEQGDDADRETLMRKRAALEDLETPIIIRWKEHKTRPKAIDDFQKIMSAARLFLVDSKKNLTQAIADDQPSRHTEEELDGLFDQLKANEDWAIEKLAAQKKLEDELTSDPAVMSADLNEKGKALQMTVSASLDVSEIDITSRRVDTDLGVLCPLHRS